MVTIVTCYLVATVGMSIRLACQLAIERWETHARFQRDQAELDRMLSGMGCR